MNLSSGRSRRRTDEAVYVPYTPVFDDRQLLYWRCDAYRADDVVPITQMGGLMTFRAKAVAGMTFDASAKKRRVRDDDRDFCFDVGQRVGRGPRVFGMVGARLTPQSVSGRPLPRSSGKAEGRKPVLPRLTGTPTSAPARRSSPASPWDHAQSSPPEE